MFACAAPTDASVRQFSGRADGHGGFLFVLDGVSPQRLVAGSVRFPGGTRRAVPVPVLLGALSHRGRLRLSGGARRPAPRARAAARLSVWLDTDPPTQPTGLRAAPFDSGATLRWSPASDDRAVTEYVIERAGAPIAHVDGDTLSFTATGLQNGRAVAFGIHAEDAAGNASSLSDAVRVTPVAGVVQGSAVFGPIGQLTLTETQPAATPVAPGGVGPSPPPPNKPPPPVIVNPCDHYAAPAGSDAAAGTKSAPFATAQRLADALAAGQTGCLRDGPYTMASLRFNHGGAPGAPITLRGAPGERAIVHVGQLYVPPGSDDVTISDMRLDVDYDGSTPVGIQIWANYLNLKRNDITAGSRASCVIVGNEGFATRVATLIQGNRFHDCGDPAHGNQDHAIYLDNATGATVTDNVFWHSAAYAVHLYPHAVGSVVSHNVISDSGVGGMILAGTATLQSSDNLIAQNIISGSAGADISTWWPGAIGTSNAAVNNCFAPSARASLGAGLPGLSASGNLVVDPQFLGPASHDFRLAAGSPCLALVSYDTAARVLAWVP